MNNISNVQIKTGFITEEFCNHNKYFRNHGQ